MGTERFAFEECIDGVAEVGIVSSVELQGYIKINASVQRYIEFVLLAHWVKFTLPHGR
eukprot:SAG31_NODE_31153_length_371_cov_1.125000_2_plen_57_part_01